MRTVDAETESKMVRSVRHFCRGCSGMDEFVETCCMMKIFADFLGTESACIKIPNDPPEDREFWVHYSDYRDGQAYGAIFEKQQVTDEQIEGDWPR